MKLIILKVVLSSLTILGSYTLTSAQSVVKSETIDNTQQLEDEKYQKEKYAQQSDQNKMTAEYASAEKYFNEIIAGTAEEMTDESLKMFHQQISQWLSESENNILVLDERQTMLYNQNDFKRLYMYSVDKRKTSKK